MKNSGLLDATIGSYDGADVCKLVGICMLKTISQSYSNKNFVLYRDDSLAVTKTVRSQKKEKRKNFWKLLANATWNSELFGYYFELNDAFYKSYRKLDSKICYVHKESKHSPANPTIGWKFIIHSIIKRRST